MVDKLLELFESGKNSEAAKLVVESLGCKSASEKLCYGRVDSYSVADLNFLFNFFPSLPPLRENISLNALIENLCSQFGHVYILHLLLTIPIPI